MKGVYLKKGNTKVSVVPYYRVGDLFLTTIATNPSNYLGGKWELFGPGRCLVCVDTSQTEFNSVKKTGGSKYLQKHKHNGLYWLGGSQYPISLNPGGTSTGYKINWSGSADGNKIATAEEGAGNSGNLQPYITCYVWIRTA